MCRFQPQRRVYEDGLPRVGAGGAIPAAFAPLPNDALCIGGWGRSSGRGCRSAAQLLPKEAGLRSTQAS
jgi:hypothetical protein